MSSKKAPWGRDGAVSCLFLLRALPRMYVQDEHTTQVSWDSTVDVSYPGTITNSQYPISLSKVL